MTEDDLLREAAEQISSAEALLIGAGAGMGVDSGLPDFRGAKGFWRAYPAYKKRKLDFASMANPRWFALDPDFAWGFYGHRLNLYRATVPHSGFRLLLSWAKRMRLGAFVYTSNVDGQFQKAGFDPERIYEVHGSIHHLQCTADCGIGIFSADSVEVCVDESDLRARSPLPSCPACGAVARPNILMFGDWGWDDAQSSEQANALDAWLEQGSGVRCVVVECGAGTAIPTVRHFCEDAAKSARAKLIRINVREAQVPPGHVGVPLGAQIALERIAEKIAVSP